PVMRNLLLLLTLSFALIGQKKADWTIKYELPNPVKANYDTTLTVKITDSKGKPVEGAQVETVLTMIEMDHGEFKEVASQVKPGVYEAKQKFIMVGAFQIEVRAKKGDASTSQKFKYEVKE